LEAKQLTKIYGGGGNASHRALDGFDLVEAGEFVGIMGPSGSGKTTLLHLVGTLDVPTSGEIRIGGQEVTRLRGEELFRFRRRHLGFVFQDFQLLEALTLRENILLPTVLEKQPPEEMTDQLKRLDMLAERLQITNVLNRRPPEVSGGQKQRAATARALIHRPTLLLADEPTGNLDSAARRVLLTAFSDINRSEGTTIIMVTHDPVSASYCDRVLMIQDGRLFTEIRRGADQRAFFRHILAVMAAWGGESLALRTLARKQVQYYAKHYTAYGLNATFTVFLFDLYTSLLLHPQFQPPSVYQRPAC
jgi:putative ABC transport system ATP-binding protein